MKLTVLMPVYNGGPYLKEAIDSILAQSFTDFEFLIIDDGSTDDSVSIIKSYSDKRIRLEKNLENLKLIRTLNYGVSIAKGAYIARFDCDDTCPPDRLKIQMDFLEMNKEIGLCGTWFDRFGAGTGNIKKPVSFSEIKAHLLFDTSFCHASIVAKKQLLENNPYDLTMLHTEDYDLFSRCAKVACMENVPQYLYNVRITNHSTTGALTTDERKVPRMAIQQREIENLCTPTDAQKEIHYKIAHPYMYRTTLTIDELKLAEDWLLHLINLNKEIKYFDQKILLDLFNLKWFQLCFSASKLGIPAFDFWRKSLLNNNGRILNFNASKFLAKSLLKK